VQVLELCGGISARSKMFENEKNKKKKTIQSNYFNFSVHGQDGWVENCNRT